MGDVYLHSAGVVSAAGRGLGAAVAALRNPAPRPVRIRIRELQVDMSAPYLPVPVATERKRLEALLDIAVGDALAATDPAVRGAMPVFIGSSSFDISAREDAYEPGLASTQPVIPFLNPNNGLMAEQVATRFGVQGPQFTINTACSSAANALLYAAQMIRRGDCRHALVIGSEVGNRVSQAGFQALMLAADSACRPFDINRSGLVLGEAVAAVVLSAEPGVGELAGFVLRGGATACDPASATNAGPVALAGVMSAALAQAGVSGDAIGAVKAHGTGTPSNDTAEAHGLRACFGHSLPPITSIKPVLGHTLGACGLLETLAMAACWTAGFLPPTAGFEQPDPDLKLIPARTAMTLDADYMLLNYFGFGGNNSSLVLARTA